MEIIDYIELVSELNQELYNDHNIDSRFSYTTDGLFDSISFDDKILWYSDDDDREWIESKNDYEPLKPFIKKKLNKYIDELVKIKFKRIKK